MPADEHLAELGMCCTQPWTLWKWGAALFIHAAVGVLFACSPGSLGPSLAPWTSSVSSLGTCSADTGVFPGPSSHLADT